MLDSHYIYKIGQALTRMLVSYSPLRAYNYHLFTETEGNSVFCGLETAVVARGETSGNNGGQGATKHTAFPRSQ